MTRNSIRCVLHLAVVILVPALANAQLLKERQKAKPLDEQPVIKIYRIVDLVLPAPNYPYNGTYLPQEGRSEPSTGGQRMFGGGGMGEGGGLFQVSDHLAQIGGGGGTLGLPRPAPVPHGPPAHRAGVMGFNTDDLIEAITTIVEPSTWDEVGGEGSIDAIGGTLAVRQTPAVQKKVEEFLKALEQERGALKMLTIEARWLSLDRQQLAGLGEKTGSTVDPAALGALPDEVRRYLGQITCFNGQTVHIVSGRMESVVAGLIPIIGRNVGYQPVMESPHLGVLLQITPFALPAGDGVLVDLHSSITRWEEASKAAHIGTAPDSDVSIEVDRINVSAQQFATSMRVPLGKPVLVGGLTFPAGGKTTQDGPAAEQTEAARPGLYLVIEVHATGA